MAENSKIEWTHHTFNHVIGCTKVAPGCMNCYAEADFDKRRHVAQWGPNGTRIKTSPENWAKPLKWNRDAERDGVRTRVFCASLSDVFEDWSGPILNSHGEELRFDPELGVVSLRDADEGDRATRLLATLDDVRRDLFLLIDATPHIDWLLLTKRPENVLRMWPRRQDYEYQAEAGLMNEYPMNRRDNVWLGTSISDQATADKAIPELLKCRSLCPVLFISAEPLLGPVDLRRVHYDGLVEIDTLTGDHGITRPLAGRSDAKIDWVIVGGESGHDARPMHPEWAISLCEQCLATGVPFLFKQWGEWIVDRDSSPPDAVETTILKGSKSECTVMARPSQSVQVVRVDGRDRLFAADGTFTGDSPQADDAWMVKVGKKLAGRLLDGREWNEYPVTEGPVVD